MAKAGAEKETQVCNGFIAQEVEQAAKATNYDFSGVHHPQNDKDFYALNYSAFVVPLVKAAQELSQKNDQKDSAISTLQSTVSDLQKQITELKTVSNNTSASMNGFAELKEMNAAPQTILGQNIPNPFDNSTLIPFRIPKNCHDASIMIINTSTSDVVSVIPISCNEDHVSIDAGVLASGAYSYTLYVDGKMIDAKEMILTK